MPPSFVPSANLWAPNSIPQRMFSKSESGATSHTFDYYAALPAGHNGIILGIDVICTDFPTVSDIVVNYFINNIAFYHDSQTIGEGAGVDYAWRGQLPYLNGEHVKATVVGSAASTTVSCVMWGLVMDFDGTWSE